MHHILCGNSLNTNKHTSHFGIYEICTSLVWHDHVCICAFIWCYLGVSWPDGWWALAEILDRGFKTVGVVLHFACIFNFSPLGCCLHRFASRLFLLLILFMVIPQRKHQCVCAYVCVSIQETSNYISVKYKSFSQPPEFTETGTETAGPWTAPHHMLLWVWLFWKVLWIP